MIQFLLVGFCVIKTWGIGQSNLKMATIDYVMYFRGPFLITFLHQYNVNVESKYLTVVSGIIVDSANINFDLTLNSLLTEITFLYN